jgi:hypothetical protein
MIHRTLKSCIDPIHTAIRDSFIPLAESIADIQHPIPHDGDDWEGRKWWGTTMQWEKHNGDWNKTYFQAMDRMSIDYGLVVVLRPGRWV